MHAQTAVPDVLQPSDALRLLMRIDPADEGCRENCVNLFAQLAVRQGWPRDKIEAFLPRGYSLREWPWNFSSWPVSKTATELN